MVMKPMFLYPTYATVNGRGCCRFLNVKHAAMTGAIYTMNIAILVVLLYSWIIGVNMKKYADLQDVYYGVQIAYFAIIGTQLFMIVLCITLLIGIHKVKNSHPDSPVLEWATLHSISLKECKTKFNQTYDPVTPNEICTFSDSCIGPYFENIGLVMPWIIGLITFTALEAVSMVYSNVLRDHVNRQFDALCKAEMAFFVARTITNLFALYAVKRFYHMLRVGVSWKDPEAIEL